MAQPLYRMGTRLEGDDCHTGNSLEVLRIQGCHVEAEMKGGGSDEQILESDDVAAGSLLTLNAPSKLRDFKRYRMNDEVPAYLLRKGLAAYSIRISPGARDAVCQFHNADSGKRYFNLTMSDLRPLEYLFNTFRTAFARD
jgi:hypothetical protein